MTALRTIAVYALMLVVIRVSGKRAIGNFTAFDLLVALMLGEVVDEIAYGDVSFAQGATVILVVAALQYGNAWLSFAHRGAARILEGSPRIIIRDGAMEKQGMRKERMSPSDVMAELRGLGVSDLREVKLAVLEVDGRVSVIKHEWAESLRKRDLASTDPDNATDGSAAEVPESHRTDAEWALGGRA
ncbi:MAG: YetF domain-containing protein [Gemmatimonadaceae bacterium]